MFSTRFSLNGMLLGMADIVLLLSAIASFGNGRTVDAPAHGSLCICTLLFSLLCNLFELPASRTLLVGGVFYAWGRSCLYFADAYDPSIPIRVLFGLLGMWYAIRVLIRPWNPIPGEMQRTS